MCSSGDTLQRDYGLVSISAPYGKVEVDRSFFLACQPLRCQASCKQANLERARLMYKHIIDLIYKCINIPLKCGRCINIRPGYSHDYAFKKCMHCSAVSQTALSLWNHNDTALLLPPHWLLTLRGLLPLVGMTLCQTRWKYIKPLYIIYDIELWQTMEE